MIGRKRISTGECVFQGINYVLFTVITLLCIFPFYYIFVLSISDNKLVSLGQVMLYPKGIHFMNYVNVLKIKGFLRAGGISLARTIIGPFLTVFTSAFMGYSFAKKEFWMRKVWYKFLVITMYFNVGLIPTYLNIRNLGLTDKFWIYIIGFVAPYYIILCKTFIEALPESLEESAKLDGAGYLNTFFCIIFPLSMPITATICVFSAVGHWSSYMDTLLYVRNSRLYTLQYVLYNYLNSAQYLSQIMRESSGSTTGVELSTAITATSVKMTVTMVVTLPVLFVYPFFQRYFVKGIMIGAIKG